MRVEDRGILVRLTDSTRQWASGPKQALVPRDLVTAVRFSGRTGRRGLIGGLAGLAAGVAIPAAAAASGDTYAYLAIPLAVPAFGLAGYLAGHFSDKPAPEFLIE